MKFTSLAACLTVFLLPSLSLADTVAYDETYDDGSESLSTVACSDGANGLETRGYTVFSSLPSFPYIGAAAAVTGWNSASCGTCWELSYTSASGVTNTINVLAIDVAGEGFNIALEAMNTLTGGLGVELGRVNATSTQVAPSVCGL